MPLIVLNPSPTTKPRKGKGGTMAKRHRSPAQRAATKKMLAARRHRNPSHPKRVSRRYKVASRRRNPSNPRRHVYKARRRRVTRNPALFASGGLFGELLSVEGLMMAATVVVMPTVTELATSMIAPTLTGYSRAGVKAGIGIAAAVVLDKIVGRKVALIASLLAIGTGVMEAVKVYNGTPGYGTPGSASFVGPPATVNGYLSGRGRKRGGMNGYSGRPAPFMSGYNMGGPFPEPGTL